jgi:hypothetical protein
MTPLAGNKKTQDAKKLPGSPGSASEKGKKNPSFHIDPAIIYHGLTGGAGGDGALPRQG